MSCVYNSTWIMHSNMCSHYLWCEQLPILFLSPHPCIPFWYLRAIKVNALILQLTGEQTREKERERERETGENWWHTPMYYMLIPRTITWGVNPWAIRCLLLHVKSHLHTECMRLWIGKVNETTHALQINVVQCNGHRPKVGFVIIGMASAYWRHL